MPSLFLTVPETGRDVAEKYIETPVGSLTEHKFVELTEVNSDISELKKERYFKGIIKLHAGGIYG